ncbi:MAG: hypothetical protein LBE78_08960 [Burkholderiaceae bacterium]|nr:hypothetical protein [Burkholderiaceae bacterium]
MNRYKGSLGLEIGTIQPLFTAMSVLGKAIVKHVQENKDMRLNILTFQFVFLLSWVISGCMSLVDKSEIEALRRNPILIPGEEYWPCCMKIVIIDQYAKDIFDKMPDSTLLTTPTKGTCLDGGVVKFSEGTMCSARESDLSNPALYSCQVMINYSTGTTEKININDYLDCDEED